MISYVICIHGLYFYRIIDDSTWTVSFMLKNQNYETNVVLNYHQKYDFFKLMVFHFIIQLKYITKSIWIRAIFPNTIRQLFIKRKKGIILRSKIEKKFIVLLIIYSEGLIILALSYLAYIFLNSKMIKFIKSLSDNLIYCLMISKLSASFTQVLVR